MIDRNAYLFTSLNPNYTNRNIFDLTNWDIFTLQALALTASCACGTRGIEAAKCTYTYK
jgi:hypothetical protein